MAKSPLSILPNDSLSDWSKNTGPIRILLALWMEFEAGETPNARFAKALDRLQPLLLNTLTDGGTWTQNNVTEQQVMDRYGPVIDGSSKALWDEAAALVRDHFSKHKELTFVVKDSPPCTTER